MNMKRKQFVEVNVPRFKAYCTAFGGQRRMSAATGVSQEYIETRLNRCGGSIRADVFRKACELHSFSPKLLTGHGTDEEFRKALATKVALERLGKRKEKHQVCDSYCHGCIYECTAAATPLLPPERYCEYYYRTKQLRGCPAGQGCIRRHLRKGAESRAKVSVLLRGSLLYIRR